MMNTYNTFQPYHGNSIFFAKINGTLGVFALVSIVCSFFGPIPFLVIPSLLVLLALFKWFSTDNYPPVLLIALLYQWMQISIKIFYATFTFQNIIEITDFPDNIIQSYLFSCLALFIIMFGIKLQVKKIRISSDAISTYIELIDTKKALTGYLVFSLVASLFFGLRFVIPGMFQAIVALGYIKWSLFFIVFYVSLKKKKDFWLLRAIIIYEFLMGFISYFADFKTIVFMVLICYLGVKTFKAKQIPSMIVAAIAMGFVALAWTAVKMDYRTFLNQGSEQQVVRVEGDDAFFYLFDKFSSLDGERLNSASIDLIDRISYSDYFSSCISYVPKVLPYENGGLTKMAIMHILLPRIVYPNKPAIDDSEHLSKYTGIFYANAAMGVSFALGYVPDFYIDYGPFFMFIALFFFGLFIGFLIISIHRTSFNDLWSMAMIVPFFMLLYKFENSMIKFIGTLVTFWLTSLLFNKFVARRINNFIKV